MEDLLPECPECGSTNIIIQRFLEWNYEKQIWVITDNPYREDWLRVHRYPLEWCHDCEEEIEIDKDTGEGEYDDELKRGYEDMYYQRVVD